MDHKPRSSTREAFRKQSQGPRAVSWQQSGASRRNAGTKHSGKGSGAVSPAAPLHPCHHAKPKAAPKPATTRGVSTYGQAKQKHRERLGENWSEQLWRVSPECGEAVMQMPPAERKKRKLEYLEAYFE